MTRLEKPFQDRASIGRCSDTIDIALVLRRIPPWQDTGASGLWLAVGQIRPWRGKITPFHNVSIFPDLPSQRQKSLLERALRRDSRPPGGCQPKKFPGWV